MSKFTDRLWRELVREHGADLAQTRRPAAGPRRHARPRLLAGTTVGLAGVGSVVALAIGAAGTSPAFAVTSNSDGTVSVVLRAPDGITGANAKLAALGIRARFVQVLAGCAPPPPVALFASRNAIHTMAVLRGNYQTKIDPRQIPADRTLVIASWQRSRTMHMMQVNALHGVVPRCLPWGRVAIAPGCQVTIAAQAPDNGGNGVNGGNSGQAGNSGSGNSASAGNSGPGWRRLATGGRARARATCDRLLRLPPGHPAGNSGNGGNSGNSGDSGNSSNSSNSGDSGTTTTGTTTTGTSTISTTSSSDITSRTGTSTSSKS